MGILFSSTTATTVPTTCHSYGWKRGRGDVRDLWFDATNHDVHDNIDLRPECPDVYDQGTLGSCTANAIAACYEFALIEQSSPWAFTPSRLFIYYNEREMEGHVGEDSGAEIRDGIKSINTVGVCPETDWPYDVTKFTQKPKPICYEIAQDDHSVEYRRVRQTRNDLCAALTVGFPVAFGFLVYESFESAEVASTGVMPMPEPTEKVLGGHAVVAVGFDEERGFIIRNSWGDGWGNHGYFYMPEQFLLDPSQCSDFWTVTLVVSEKPVPEGRA